MAPKLKKKSAATAGAKPPLASDITRAVLGTANASSSQNSSPSTSPAKPNKETEPVDDHDGLPPADDVADATATGVDELDADAMVFDDVEVSAELLAAIGDGDEPVLLRPEDLQELEEYRKEIGSWREETETTSASNRIRRGASRAQGDAEGSVDATALHNREGTFTFSTLVKNVLPPELAHQGHDTVADALLEVTSARLDCLGMQDTSTLECLTNLVHLHAQRNRIDDLSGLEFMLNLNVVLLRGNRITSLDPIALLPIRVLDVAENCLESLELVTAVLPFETLEKLSLEDNPGTIPSSKSQDRSDAATVLYRNAVLSTTPFLTVLDGLTVSRQEQEENAMDFGEKEEEDDGTGAINDGGEEGTTLKLLGSAGMPRQEFGLNTTVKDDDFLQDDDEEDVDEGRDNDDAVPTSGGTAGQKKGPTTATDTSSGHQYIADGVVSKVGQMSRDLLRQYQEQLDAKTAMAAAAADYEAVEGDDDANQDGTLLGSRQSSHHVDPEKAPPTAESKDEPSSSSGDYRRPPQQQQRVRGDPESIDVVRFRQRELRDELRQMNTHQSHVATAHATGMWRDADRQFDEITDRAADRRRRMQYEQSAPSAAYQRALQMLKESAGTSDLDKYRQPVKDPKQQPTTATPVAAIADRETPSEKPE